MAKKMDGPKSKSGKKKVVISSVKRKMTGPELKEMQDTYKKEIGMGMAMNKTLKPIEQKSLQRITKKLSDSQRIEKRPLDTSVPSKKDMIKRVNTKMVENAYDAGLLRYNRGGQDNPTPYPRVEASKKPKMASRIVSRLKKK